MRRLRDHFERWNIWRRVYQHSKLYKILVLIGLIRPTTLYFVCTPRAAKKVLEAFEYSFDKRFWEGDPNEPPPKGLIKELIKHDNV